MESDSLLQNPSQNLGPFLITTFLAQSVFILLPSLWDKSRGNPSSPRPGSLSQDQHEPNILCTSPPCTHTHFLPCPPFPPPFTPRFLHPSLISLANLNRFPFAARIFFSIFFFKGKRYFPSCFQPFPSPPVFRLVGLDP